MMVARTSVANQSPERAFSLSSSSTRNWVVPGDTERAGGGGMQPRCGTLVHLVSLLHLPSLHSSCRFVIRYLKNSYTDHAMAVEGIW